jgi:hypothetical protein
MSILSPRRRDDGSDKFDSPRKNTVTQCVETYRYFKNHVSSLKDLDEQSVLYVRGIIPSYEIYKSGIEYVYSLSHLTEDVCKTESSFGISFKVNTEKSSQEATGQLMGKTLLELGKLRENLVFYNFFKLRIRNCSAHCWTCWWKNSPTLN